MSGPRLRYYLQTQHASDVLMALPTNCPVCGADVELRYQHEGGAAGGRCARRCGWDFTRTVVDPRATSNA